MDVEPGGRVHCSQQRYFDDVARAWEEFAAQSSLFDISSVPRPVVPLVDGAGKAVDGTSLLPLQEVRGSDESGGAG